MGAYEAVLRTDLERYMPFLSTTTLLMESVRQGAGREQAHEAIKEHSVALALEMREQGLKENDLAHRLGNDHRIPFAQNEIENLFQESENYLGLAAEQVDQFTREVGELLERYPKSAQLGKNRLL